MSDAPSKVVLNRSRSLRHGFAVVLLATLCVALVVDTSPRPAPEAATESSGDGDAHSYVVYKDRGTYVALSGAPRLRTFSGTSASQVVNAALAELGAVGGHIKVRAGTYAIDAPIDFSGVHNTILEGEGVRTTFKASADVDVIRIVGRGETLTDNVVCHLQVIGYADANPATTKSGIIVRNTTNTKIDRCWVTKCDHGVYLYSTENCRSLVSHCICWDNDDDGIADTGGRSSIIEGNWCFGNGDCGLHLVHGDKRIVHGNHLDQNGVSGGSQHGIAVENVSNSTLSSNIITLNARDGIHLTNGSSGNVIEGNIIKANKHAGILLRGPTTLNNTVVGNHLLANGNQSAMYHDGICVDHHADGTVLSSNTISNSGQWGIYIASTVEATIVVACNCRDETQGIIDYGVHSHINLCWNGTRWIA